MLSVTLDYAEEAAMLSSNAVFDSLRSSTFAEGDQAFVNTVLYGTFAINADVIQSLRKILEKTTLAANTAVGVRGVTCVLNCLLHLCEQDECRTFLNLVNSSLGSRQLVYTFPCERAFLGGKEVFKPKDAQYKEFWVDFNMGSRCVSILCDSSSLSNNTEGNIWEVVSIPCGFVKRVILDRGIFGIVAPKGAQSLILEMGELHQRDIQEYLVSAKQVKIIFKQSSDLACLIDKVLPVLFGEVFQDMKAARKGEISSVSNLKVPQQTQNSLFRRAAKISTSGVALVSVSGTAPNHLSKYKPLQIVKSPRNCGISHSQGTRAGRTEVVVTCMAKGVEPAEPLEADKQPIQKSPDIQTPDPSKDLQELLTAHHIQTYEKNPTPFIISPQLSCINEEELSQTSAVTHETCIVSGPLALPPLSNVHENFLNVQSVTLHQHNQPRECTEKRKEMAGRYWESSPVASFRCKGGKENYEAAGQSSNCIASCSASVAASIHVSRTDRIENKIVKCKFSSSYRMNSVQTSCIKGALKLRSSELQREDMNLNNSIPSTTEQHAVNEIISNKEAKLLNHKPSMFISSFKDSIKPNRMEQNVVRKDTFIVEQGCYKTKKCSRALGLEEESLNSACKFKSGSVMVQSERTKSSENSLLINSDSKDCKTVSSIKISCERPNTLLHNPQELIQDSSKNSAEFGKVMKVTGTEVALFERPKELLHKPEELTEGSFLETLQSIAELQKDKNNLSARSVSESSSASQKLKTVDNKKIVLSHRTKEFLDRPLEQTNLSDVQNNVQNYSDVEMRQAAISTVTFRKLCKQMHNTEDGEATVSMNNLALISDSQEGKLVASIKANTIKKSKTSLYKCQEQDECLAVENCTQNDPDVEETQQTANFNATFTRFKRLRTKRIKSSASENVSINSSGSQVPDAKNMSTEKVKDFLHKPHKDTDITLLKNDAQNDSDILEDKQASCSKKMISGSKRLRDKHQVEVSVLEDCAKKKSDSPSKTKTDTKEEGTVRFRKICNMSKEQVESSVKNNTPSCSEGNTVASFRNTIEGSARLHNKQQEEGGNSVVSNSDPLLKSTAVKSKKLTKKSQEQVHLFRNNVQSDSNFVEDRKTASSRNIIKGKMRLNNNQKKKPGDCAVNSDAVSKPAVDTSRFCDISQEESEAFKNNAHHESDVVGHKKTVHSRKIMEKSKRLHKKQQDILGNCTLSNLDFLAEPTADRSGGLHKKPEEQIDSLKNKAQNVSDFAEGKIPSSRTSFKRSKRVCRKQVEETVNPSVSNTDSLAKPTSDRSVGLCKKQEQVELPNSEQEIISTVLRPKRLIHEGEKKIGSSNPKTLDPIQNEQQGLTKKAVANRQEKSNISDKIIGNLIPEKFHANEQMACNDTPNNRSKEMENITVSGGKSPELYRGRQRQVLHKSQMVTCPGIVREERAVDNHANSEFSAILTDGKSHEAENALDKLYSKNDTSSDHCTKQSNYDRIESKDSDGLHVSRNNWLSSHGAQKYDGSKHAKLAFPSDTSCASNIQKHVTSTPKDNCSENRNFTFRKTHAKMSGSVFKMESEKRIKKCIQEVGVIKKPSRSRLDPSKVWELIKEWDSDVERVRSDEFSQDEQPSSKGMIPKVVEVITNPSVDKIQQHLKERDINKADDKREDLLLDEAAATNLNNGQNPGLTLNVESHEHPKSPLLSHISVELNNADANTLISKDEGLILSKNSESEYALNSERTQKLFAPKNVKSHELKNLCSHPNTDNLKQTQGLTITKKVPSPETPVKVSKTQEKSNDSIKVTSQKRKLYSTANSPEVIELEDCNDTCWSQTSFITCPSRQKRRRIQASRKSSVTEPPIKKLQGGNRKRRKKEASSACSGRDQLGVSVSNFGGLSQKTDPDLSKSSQFSLKSFSGRWRDKYLEEVKHKLDKKHKENVERPLYNSVYSDIETDSDSIISWLEPTKPKRLEIVQKPKITYEKKGRIMFPSKQRKKQLMACDTERGSDSIVRQLELRKSEVSEIVQEPKVTYEEKNGMISSSRQKKKEVLCPKQLGGQAPFPRSEKRNIRPKIKRDKLNNRTAEKHISPGKKTSRDPGVETLNNQTAEEHISPGKETSRDPGVETLNNRTAEKHISPGKKTSRDPSVETFLTHAVENRLPDFDLFRSDENEQMEEPVPVEINILPCHDGAVTSDNGALPSLITEAENSTKSKIPNVKDKELLSDKRVEKVNVESTGKSAVTFLPHQKREMTDQRKDDPLQYSFGLNSASSDMNASISEVIASSTSLSKLTHTKEFVHQDHISSSSDKEEVPESTAPRDDLEEFVKRFPDSSQKEGNPCGNLECNNVTVMRDTLPEGQKGDRTKVTNPCTAQARDYMMDFMQNSAKMIEENFRQIFLKGSKKRNLLVADHIQNLETEMEQIQSSVKHLNQQEQRWQKLEDHIKCSFQLQRGYFDEMSENKVRLSNSHHHFNKCWQKLEKEQQNLPLVEADGNLKQQLHELMAKKLEEESKNDVARLRARLQAILSCM